jgi:prevent-host-death family protein
MCDMGDVTVKSRESRVGVRELRQNLSVYLDRVKEGERLEVTEHGRPVALLVPLPPKNDVLARLRAEGKLSTPKGDFREWLDNWQPLDLPPREDGKSLFDILIEMRDEERS